MNNEIIFNHNFCESRINNYQTPEVYNAISSLFVTLVPLCCGKPKNEYFKNVRYMLLMNGFFSCYYHYTLSWYGKHLDEVTMIFANYHGIKGLLKFYSIQYESSTNVIHTCLVPIFIAFNTLPQYDFMFPHLFGFYVAYSTYLIQDVAKVNNISKTVNGYLLVSAIGGSCWIISELFCNEYTTYGHVLWHLLFPFGIYKILLMYDSLLSI
jgi:hypothetical protein